MTQPARLTVIKRQPVVDSPSVERTSIAFASNEELTLTEYAPNTARFRFSDTGNFEGLLIEHDPYQSVIESSEDFTAAGWRGKTRVYQNFALESEGLDQAGTWIRTELAGVNDSGIAAPTIDGETFGNYWKIVPNTTSTIHYAAQQGIPVPASGSASFLIRSGGYDGALFRLSPTGSIANLADCRFDASTGVFAGVTTPFDSFSATDLGGGDWLVDVGWSGLATAARINMFVRSGGSETFAGNGTDGILVTRVQVKENPKARYETTTTSIVDYVDVESITIDGQVDGPDGEIDSATTVDLTGNKGIEYFIPIDYDLPATTFNYGSSTPVANGVINFVGVDDDTPPTVFAVGTQVTATTAPLTVPWPGSHQTDDIGVVVMEQDQAELVPTVSGWTRDISEVAATGTNGTRLVVFWARATSGSMADFSAASGISDHRTARMIVIRGCKATGNPYDDLEVNNNTDPETAITVPGITSTVNRSLAMFFSAYGIDAATNVTTAWTNSRIGTITTHVNGTGTTSGNGGGIAVASGVFNVGTAEGIIIGGGDARPSVFFRKESGTGTTARVYNALGTQAATFDADTGALLSGDGTSQLYDNGFYRFSLGITGSSDDIGFGMDFDGVASVYGANLMPSYGPHEYMRDDTLFTGDTEVPYTGASLVYSNIPEPAPQDAGPNGPATIWQAGSYNTNDHVVYSDHFVYRAATTTTTVPDVGVNETPPKWVRRGPSERWKMFIAQEPGVDGVVYGVEVATVGDGFIENLLAPTAGDYIPAYAVHGMDAGTLTETIYNGETIVSEREINLVSNEGVTDWLVFFELDRANIEQFYSGELNYNPDFRLKLRWDGGDAPVVGKLVIGDPKEIGFTIDKIDIRDRTFGTKERDDNGNLIYQRGRSTNTITYRAWVEQDRKSYAEQQLKSIGTDPTSYIGLLGDELTMAYGTRDNRNLSFNLFEARMTVQVETV